MQRAIAEMTMLALAGGAVGCWVVLYETSYAAESLAHSLFPGLVLAALAGVPLLVGATPAIVLAALAIAIASRAPGVTRDVAVAVAVTTMFGLGVLLALAPESPPGVESLLFGDILGPSDADLTAAAVLLVLVASTLPFLHARFLATGFDRAAAQVLGVSPAVTEAVLLVLLAASIVVAVQGLGNLLVVAVFVGPAAAARNLCRRSGSMVAASALIGALAGIGGLYLSYYAGTAGGASVALAILFAYLLSIPLRWLRGVGGGKRPTAGATIG
ncbi:MAG TPA: metal ABC transporter permease [Solirubrobacterales bacterium]|nr:metal ABC transporter permease [Solirubrobacterales bacterium]